jgi:plasmid stability protein
MATLYIRDVPEAVAEALKARAAETGTSLSAYLARELADIAARPTNAETVRRLKARDRTGCPSTEDILKAVAEGRK